MGKPEGNIQITIARARRAAGPRPTWIDLLAANTLAMVVPFLLFRYVMLGAFLTFHQRVSIDELIWCLPAVVFQDLLLALGIAAILTLLDLATRSRRSSIGKAARVLGLAAPSLVAVLVTCMYAVYLDFGFFPDWQTIWTHLAPGGPLMKTAATYVTTQNVMLLGLVIIVPLIVKMALLRMRWIGRIGLTACLLSLGAGAVWPVPETIAQAGVHPFGQVYDALLATEPQWDIEDWADQPLSFASISNTVERDPMTDLSGAFAGCNVVMVLMESTGRQYLYDRQEGWRFPSLRRLADHAVDFARYYSPADASIPSLFPLFTSQWPIPMRGSQWYFPKTGRVVWSTRLKQDHGYRIGFFHAGSFGAWFDRDLFETFGWDVFEDAGAVANRYGIAPESTSRLREMIDESYVVRRVTEWIAERRERGERFFACYRNGIPHLPYDFADGHQAAIHTGEQLTPMQSYENELARVDAAIGELYDSLYESGFFENGVLIITADHGEAFAQHPGVVVHSTHIYNENIHVPLLVVHPDRLIRRVSDNVGCHVDFGATLYDLLGLNWPGSGAEASLLGDTDRDLTFVASVENGLKAGVIDGRWKFIWDRGKAKVELFDLQTDPGELADAADLHADWVDRYKTFAQTYVARALADVGDEEDLSLRAHLDRGRRMIKFGKLEAAREHFAEALEIEPQSPEALTGYGRVLRLARRCSDATATLRKALSNGASWTARVELASALICAGNPEEAARQCRTALDNGHDTAIVHRTLAIALNALGRVGEAQYEFERAIDLDPTDAESHERLGRLLIEQGQAPEGRRHLDAARRIDPTRNTPSNLREKPDRP